MTETKTQWRFMWGHAMGDENGAQWRDTPPSQEEYAEWKEDFNGNVWVEFRYVTMTAPSRDFSYV